MLPEKLTIIWILLLNNRTRIQTLSESGFCIYLTWSKMSLLLGGVVVPEDSGAASTFAITLSLCL